MIQAKECMQYTSYQCQLTLVLQIIKHYYTQISRSVIYSRKEGVQVKILVFSNSDQKFTVLSPIFTELKSLDYMAHSCRFFLG